MGLFYFILWTVILISIKYAQLNVAIAWLCNWIQNAWFHWLNGYLLKVNPANERMLGGGGADGGTFPLYFNFYQLLSM